MNRWQALVSVLVLLLIGLTAFLSYRLYVVTLQAQASKGFLSRVAANGRATDAAVLEPLYAEGVQLYAEHPTDRLRSALFDLSVSYAWAAPTKAVAPLRTAIKLGRKMYSEYGRRGAGHQGYPSAEDVGSQLSFIYMLAGLPQEVQRWDGELILKAPYLRGRVHLYEAYALMEEDNPAGARALVEKDLNDHAGPSDPRVLAMAVYTLLHDYHAALRYETAMRDGLSLDTNNYWIYADYLIDEQRFDDARQLLRQSSGNADANAYIWLQTAIATAERDGLDSAAVREALGNAASDPRAPTSIPGATASAAGRLWYVTGDAKWWQKLAATAVRHPEDSDVVSTLVQCWTRRPPSAALLNDSGLPSVLATPEAAAQAAVAAAHTPQQQMLAQQSVVLAACLPLPSGGYDRGTADIALTALRLSFGDPELPGSVKGELMPEYTDLLTAPVVKVRRAAEPEFDKQVHAAVIALLNRRQELFRAEVPLQPLPDTAAAGPSAPGAPH